MNSNQLKIFALTIYTVYKKGVNQNLMPIQKIDPIANEVCKRYRWNRKQFSRAMEILLGACLSGEVPYRLALHSDMTPQQAAGWCRRKHENRIFVDHYPVYLIEMTERLPETGG